MSACIIQMKVFIFLLSISEPFGWGSGERFDWLAYFVGIFD